MISCLMVTQPGREHFAAQAKEDWEQQTFPERELVIVHDDGRPLGELRNEAVKMAAGDIVAIWDDDDRRHPDYLALLRAGLGGGDAVFLDQVTLVCSCGWEGVSMSRLWECTMIARKSILPDYPPIETHEDWKLVRGMEAGGMDLRRIAGGPVLYAKLYHGTNTLDRKHYRRLFAQRPTDHTQCEAFN